MLSVFTVRKCFGWVEIKALAPLKPEACYMVQALPSNRLRPTRSGELPPLYLFGNSVQSRVAAARLGFRWRLCACDVADAAAG